MRHYIKVMAKGSIIGLAISGCVSLFFIFLGAKNLLGIPSGTDATVAFNRFFEITILWYIYGVITGAASVIYHIERLSNTQKIGIHFLIIFIPWLSLCIYQGIETFYTAIPLFIIIYVGIWAISWINHRNAEKVNIMLKKIQSKE